LILASRTPEARVGDRFAEIVAAPESEHKYVCASLPDGHIEVDSPDELRFWLRRIATECPRPLLVEVVRADGDRLSVGVGRPRSFLTYIPADGNPPYLSVFDESAGSDEVCFDCNGEPSFYAARNTVPFELAVEVVTRFVVLRDLPLPDLVAWEEV
jgi:hypothetical protein